MEGKRSTAITPRLAISVLSIIWWSSCAPLEPSGQSLEGNPKALSSIDGLVGDEPGGSGPGTVDPVDIDAANAAATKLAAFETTVHPLMKQYCSNCHAAEIQPFFAQNDASAALVALDTTSKVDYIDPDQSRIVRKLIDAQHNCWTGDCDADSGVMLAAIEEWIQKQEEAGAAPPDAALDNTTVGFAFAAAPEKEAAQDPGTIVFLAADYSDIAAPMTMMNDDPDGAVDNYLVVPMGNGGRIDNPAVQGGGNVTYTFEVAQADTYAVWGRIKSVNGTSNSFHISVDDGAPAAWGTVVTMDEWMWDRANAANGQQELTVDLQPGTHTITVHQREENTRINTLAITNQLQDFEGAEVSGLVSELRFDLLDLTGKDATLVVDAREFDAENNAYMLTNLRLETTETIAIKDVMPLINGKFNSQHATFRIVDQTVEAPGGELSGAALIILGEDGWTVDELSFAFGEIN